MYHKKLLKYNENEIGKWAGIVYTDTILGGDPWGALIADDVDGLQRGRVAMELWDAYREDKTLAGCDLIRGERIPKGLYHLVCEILVRHTDGSFLLMQRDFGKPNYPGFYEASAGGSAIKGETAYEAAIRELWEETGIKTDRLEHIYSAKNEHTLYEGYLCETDCAKDSIVLQKNETISFLWLGNREFLDYMDSEKCIPTQRGRLATFLQELEKKSK